MRSLDFGRQFDRVLVNDAIMYAVDGMRCERSCTPRYATASRTAILSSPQRVSAMKRLASALALLVVAFAPVLSGCSARDLPPADAALAMTLMQEAATYLRYDGSLPPVAPIEHLPAAEDLMRKAYAAYSCEQRKMFIVPERMASTSPGEVMFLRSVIVHEMMHHVQCRQGRFDPVQMRSPHKNLCAIEVEAYRAQIGFLRDQGQPDAASALDQHLAANGVMAAGGTMSAGGIRCFWQ